MYHHAPGSGQNPVPVSGRGTGCSRVCHYCDENLKNPHRLILKKVYGRVYTFPCGEKVKFFFSLQIVCGVYEKDQCRNAYA